MKKIFSVILALTLCLGMLAGCGSAAASSAASEETSAATSAAQEESTSAADAEAEAAPAQEAAEADSAEEASTAEEVAPAAEAEPVVYDLPLTDTPETFSVYTTSVPGFMAAYLGENGSYNDAVSTANFAELTGVTIDFIEIDMMTFSENFNLMIASGDYPDLISGVDGYSGGLTKAYDDGIIIDVTDYVENDMPAYLQRLNEMNVLKEVTNDEGEMLAIYPINSEVIVDRGPIVRQDWLDAMDVDAPVTYDDWYDMGLEMLNNYDIDYAFYFSNVVNPSSTFSAGYDLPAIDFTESGSHFYQEDGEVKSALVSDNYKEFVRMLSKWYDAGIIGKDFFNTASDEVKSAFAGDACGACWDNADYITEDNTNEELAATGFVCAAVPVPVQEEGQTLHYSLNVDGVVQSGICISTQCEDPDLLIKAIDFSYTDQGALLSNYGIEGESYELNENGEPEWTEPMYTTEGQTFRATILTYCFNGLPTYIDVERYWSHTMGDDAIYALDLWTGADTDCANDLPDSMTFTTEESNSYAACITDLETYSNEYILKCIIGENDIDATWDDYVDTCWSMGLQDCIDAEQSAYDRYLVR